MVKVFDDVLYIFTMNPAGAVPRVEMKQDGRIGGKPSSTAVTLLVAGKMDLLVLVKGSDETTSGYLCMGGRKRASSHGQLIVIVELVIASPAAKMMRIAVLTEVLIR